MLTLGMTPAYLPTCTKQIYSKQENHSAVDFQAAGAAGACLPGATKKLAMATLTFVQLEPFICETLVTGCFHKRSAGAPRLSANARLQK
jgi:hypothetical protein